MERKLVEAFARAKSLNEVREIQDTPSEIRLKSMLREPAHKCPRNKKIYRKVFTSKLEALQWGN